MRRRRAERLVLRAQAAIDAGCLDDARTCLTEARTLYEACPGIPELEQRLSASEPDTAPAARRHTMALAMIASAATVVLAGWVVFPRPQSVGQPAAPAAPLQTEVSQPAPTAADVQTQMRPPAPGVDPLPAPAAVFAAETAAAAANAAAAPIPSAASGAAGQQLPATLAGTAAPSPGLSAAQSTPPAAEPIRPESVAARASTPTADAAPEPVAAPPTPTPAPAPPVAAPPVAEGIPDLAGVAPSPLPAAPAPPEPSQEPAVRSVLTRYASAYSTLDVDAAHRVWPGVNRAALARAFDSLASQRISFDDCRIDVAGSSAKARCAGMATWAPKIGGGGVQQEARSWTFELARSGDGWQIVSARVQNR